MLVKYSVVNCYFNYIFIYMYIYIYIFWKHNTGNVEEVVT